jgi:hypothetical protein
LPGPLVTHWKLCVSFGQHVCPAEHSQGLSLHGGGELEPLLEQAKARRGRKRKPNAVRQVLGIRRALSKARTNPQKKTNKEQGTEE